MSSPALSLISSVLHRMGLHWPYFVIFLKKELVFKNMFVCMCVCVLPHRGHVGSLELKLLEVMSCPVWTLRTEFWSFSRAASALSAKSSLQFQEWISLLLS